MFEMIAALPNQLEQSASLEGLSDIPFPSVALPRIILCGMGGSAIAGDLVKPLLEGQFTQLTVWRNYGLPHWTTPSDLVIVCSYSGNTEECLTGLDAAGRLGCKRIAITSGGELSNQCAKPTFGTPFPLVTLPGGLPPRASLGFGLGALVRVLGRLGVLSNAPYQLSDTISQLKAGAAGRLAPLIADHGPIPVTTDVDGNTLAVDLADALVGKVPVIYTAGVEALGAGIRLRAQLNENSKTPAILAEFPELNHNDIVGWALPEELKKNFVLLILTGKLESDRLQQRVDITRDLLIAEFQGVWEIKSTGNTALARVMSLVQYGDFLSCHLARAKGIDPVPVDRITKLKDALADL